MRILVPAFGCATSPIPVGRKWTEHLELYLSLRAWNPVPKQGLSTQAKQGRSWLFTYQKAHERFRGTLNNHPLRGSLRNPICVIKSGHDIKLCPSIVFLQRVDNQEDVATFIVVEINN